MESFERRRCFRISKRLKCSRFLRGGGLIYHWRECRYFINYIHRTSDVGRACVSTRRDVGWNARHEFQPNTAPSSLPPCLSFFIPPCSLFTRVRLSAMLARDDSQMRLESRGDARLQFPPGREDGKEKLENYAVSTFGWLEINTRFLIAFNNSVLINKTISKK